MPIYEYECENCGHQFETEQRITADPLKDCPACAKSTLRRLISASMFTLKGGGWYKDGYGSSSKHRDENKIGDRLTKAVDDDKKKTAAESTSTTTSESSSSDGSSGNSSD